MAKKQSSEPRLRVGVEIAADRVIAARTDGNGAVVESVASRSMPSGTVAPNLMADNVQDRVALINAVRDALAAVGTRGKDIAVVLPDASARLSMLDFDVLPEKQQDAEGVIRFRLKKALPFDVEKAAVSYQAMPSDGGVKVVAAVAMRSVVDEYERVIREAGYAPGVVVPSMAAALGAVDASRPTLVVKVDPTTVSIAIVHDDELMLFRTIELTPNMDPEQLADDVYPAMVFVEDTYHTRVERLVVGGVNSAHFTAALEHATGLHPQELIDATKVAGSATDRAAMGGVVGALIG
jgi:type IV pilus assembly protein PilM